MKKHYLIGYNDENGKGFRRNLPYLVDIGDDIETLKETIQLLEGFNCKDITPFYVEEDEYEEDIPWTYIKKHKIEI